MKEQYNRYSMKQTAHFLHLLQTNHMEPEPLLSGNVQTNLLSLQEMQELRTACSILDEMPGGILICQADDRQQILYANRELLGIFQCETLKDFREFTGNSFREIVCPEDQDIADKKILARAPGEPPQSGSLEYRVRCKDKTIRWIEDYRCLIHCEDAGDVFYAFIGDVTDKKIQQQNQLNEALDKANMAAIAKNAFLMNISHDIRTPLNAIFGFITLAQNSLEDRESLLDYLNRVETASKKLLDMISQVLEVTALSSSDELTETECDLRKISENVYDFLKPHAQEKNLSYTLDCSGIRHSGIYTDLEKLKQIMLNLVNNAVTYTKPGGKVALTVTEGDQLPGQESVYYIKVEDTGIGISEEFINHIFEPFSREKNSTSSGIHSIGLGLTIVKSIVDKMGGTIHAKSVVGEGSTFTISLRLHTLQTDADVEVTEAAQPPRQRILLVEDNEINREIETVLLERMNFLIDPVENGLIALQKMEQASPGEYDLILMDLKMPVMDGWQTAAAIRKLPDPELANIPIIALSASIFLKDYQKSKESGINAHLAKPLNLPVLTDTIEKLTNNKKS